MKIDDMIKRGKDPCTTLVTPKVVLSSDSVYLNDALEPSLFANLKLDRENWKMTHPGQPFTAVADVTIVGDETAPRAVNMIAAVGRAGYTAISLHAGRTNIQFDYAVLAPNADISDGPTALRIEPDGAGFVLRFDPARGTQMNVASRAELTSSIAAVCASRTGACATMLVVRPLDGPFSATALLMQEVLAASPLAASRPLVRFD